MAQQRTAVETWAKPLPEFCRSNPSYFGRMFLGIRCARDEKLGTNTMQNFAKCQDPQRPNLHHDLTVILGFQKRTASKVGLMKRLNGCCHSLCKPAGAVEAMELEDQLQLADDIIHFLDAVGHSSRVKQLKRDFTTPTRKKIIIDKRREEREQAEKDVDAKIAAAVASFVAPRVLPLDTLTHINSILDIRRLSPISTPAADRVTRKVFVGVILPLTVNGKSVGGKRRRVESSQDVDEPGDQSASILSASNESFGPYGPGSSTPGYGLTQDGLTPLDFAVRCCTTAAEGTVDDRIPVVHVHLWSTLWSFVHETSQIGNQTLTEWLFNTGTFSLPPSPIIAMPHTSQEVEIAYTLLSLRSPSQPNPRRSLKRLERSITPPTVPKRYRAILKHHPSEIDSPDFEEIGHSPIKPEWPSSPESNSLAIEELVRSPPNETFEIPYVDDDKENIPHSRYTFSERPDQDSESQASMRKVFGLLYDKEGEEKVPPVQHPYFVPPVEEGVEDCSDDDYDSSSSSSEYHSGASGFDSASEFDTEDSLSDF
ncbi:hypothetical protein BDP27DRAFT_1430197 [Rhodocollybia butyracea]|uniref:Uncharacterized protein n=1 Tax=Rhodocollybia butyracea TaxID=206335 RepID=A0A9P5PDZ1_9AGAR|nr:hypothetical protein BDP27DRAFT_1430197 [Rhodocollybia butyracea]